MRERSYTIVVQSFLDSHNWQAFMKTGSSGTKIWQLAKGFIKRFLILFHVSKFDFIFIHREATPAGPPIIEWFIAKVLRKRIIYDFDDAIWLTDRKQESQFMKILKWRSKVGKICKWSYKVSCGNNYLCGYAEGFNPRVFYNPTTIDTEFKHNPYLFPIQKNDYRITLGWTGSHSTLKYLSEIEKVLQQIEQRFPSVRIMVIADEKPALNLHSLVFVPWNEKTEIQDLMAFDIGLMPLPEDEWAKGKCGFKILQYMALEIPTVASPVGVNKNIIVDGASGFLCSTSFEWLNALTKLIENKNLRNSFGRAGRGLVITHYSVSSNTPAFLSLFE